MREAVLNLERLRGCQVTEGKAKEEACEIPNKEAFFNSYVWTNPAGTFQFLQDPSGRIFEVVNSVELSVLSKTGGKKAEPRFFETLEFGMLAYPPFVGPSMFLHASPQPRRWEVNCVSLMEGLGALIRHVYGRKVTFLDPEEQKNMQISYSARVVPGTNILRIRGEAGRMNPTRIRVSRLKGELWIESFEREVYLDIDEKRILKDEFEVSFGVIRNKRIFPVSGTKNIIRVSLIEDCFVACPDSDQAILTAQESCLSEELRR
jgi:hypothetical protein